MTDVPHFVSELSERHTVTLTQHCALIILGLLCSAKLSSFPTSLTTVTEWEALGGQSNGDVEAIMLPFYTKRKDLVMEL